MEKNVKALLAKIFGIVSLVLGICGGSGLPFGVAALILSNLAKKTDPDNKDAKLGGTLGLIGIIRMILLEPLLTSGIQIVKERTGRETESSEKECHRKNDRRKSCILLHTPSVPKDHLI